MTDCSVSDYAPICFPGPHVPGRTSHWSRHPRRVPNTISVKSKSIVAREASVVTKLTHFVTFTCKVSSKVDSRERFFFFFLSLMRRVGL